MFAEARTSCGDFSFMLTRRRSSSSSSRCPGGARQLSLTRGAHGSICAPRGHTHARAKLSSKNVRVLDGGGGGRGVGGRRTQGANPASPQSVLVSPACGAPKLRSEAKRSVQKCGEEVEEEEEEAEEEEEPQSWGGSPCQVGGGGERRVVCCRGGGMKSHFPPSSLLLRLPLCYLLLQRASS